MSKQDLTFNEFMHLVIEAIEAAQLEYLIGGAVAVWAYGTVRTTQDFDVVVNLPIEQIYTFSKELEKRELDIDYLEQWIAHFSLHDVWETAQSWTE